MEGDIEGVGSISTGATCIQDGFLLHIDLVPVKVDHMIVKADLRRLGPRNPGGTRNLVHRLPFFGQQHQEFGDLDVIQFTSEEGTAKRCRFFRREILSFLQPISDISHHIGCIR